jgi:UDP-glucose 4-epimerase
VALYLITGGAGFIGSHIVRELLNMGEEVRVLDNFSTGKRENIASFLGKIELIEGDLRDLEVVKEAVQGVDYILHQGAIPSVPRSIVDPIQTNEVNIRGTLNVLVAGREANVKRVIYASSSSIYGDSPILPKREDMTPNPLSPYATSKLTGEYYCKVFYRLYGIETVILRYFNVFGPCQDPTSQYSAVIPKFIRAMLAGEPPEIYGNGHQSRDFTYVENVVIANILATKGKRVAGEILNVACGNRVTLLELVRSINEVLDTDTSPIYTAPRPGDVRHSFADISKAERLLGYNPRVDFKVGLMETVEWMKDLKIR